jgi:hypothetical protein
MSGDTPLERAKARLFIPELWRLRGWPGTPGKSCKFPDGTEKRNSASILKDGMLLHDFRSGKTYNAPALLAEVEGLSLSAAARLFIQLAGVRADDPPAPVVVRRAAPEAERKKPDLARLRLVLPSENEILALRKLRHLSAAAVQEASGRGFLRCCDSREGRAWLLRDAAGWVAVARRMDGEAWNCIGGAKARLVKGSRAAWPLGIEESLSFPAIAIVEGSPDFLAAFHFILEAGVSDDVAPVAMLGAGLSIDKEVMKFFTGKRVRIFIDDDEAGRMAFARWSGQLALVGCAVDGFNFSGLIRADGEPVKDLNDCTKISPESAARWGATLSGMMKFSPREAVPMSAPGGADNPPGSPGGWWTAAERVAIKGTEVEGDSLVGSLARQLSARVILPEWRNNLKEALCPA